MATPGWPSATPLRPSIPSPRKASSRRSPMAWRPLAPSPAMRPWARWRTRWRCAMRSTWRSASSITAGSSAGPLRRSGASCTRARRCRRQCRREYPECIDVGQMVRALWPGGIPVGNAVCQQPLQQAILFMVIEIDDVRQPGQQTALSEQNAETDHAVDLPRPGFPCFQGRWRRTAAVPCAWPRKTVRSASASLSLARGRVSASRTHPDIN